EVEEVEFNELLADYYRDNGERRFDMNFMATNFVSTFDPYLVFLGREDMQGAVNTSGLVDEELVNLAFEMRSTEPGDMLTFEQRWLKMQERYNEILPTMPIYGNVYFDFHSDWLQNYRPNAEYSWPVAILYAFYGEPAVEEAPAAASSNPQAADSPASAPDTLTPNSCISIPDITVTAGATMPPKDGVAYRPGEVINILMEAVNHSSENLRNLVITESITGKESRHFGFLHGEKIPLMIGYRVTEEDAALGVLNCTVTAVCENRNGESLAAIPAFTAFPVGK
ncbi:MAG: hypothetical protein IJ237_01700, partial [Oscillospiraceae bacterium]|nr:hypothetical protein [Oscillospiraceae bacterium]